MGTNGVSAPAGEDARAAPPSTAAGTQTNGQSGHSGHSGHNGPRGLDAAVMARDLVKRYGPNEAVKGISFDVAPGETFGLLGPNGAGKTTTISMLSTLVRPTSGTATVAGHDVCAAAGRVRRNIGLVFQATTLDLYLTAMENLRFHATLYSLPKKGLRERLRQVLDLVDLWEKRDVAVRTFSGGMKRRLEIARGLLHCPRVLFLDEPTVGLDPQTRTHIWEYVHHLKTTENVSILMTTHYMDEAEHCDRIAIIDGGRIVTLDTPAALKASIGKERVQLASDDNETVVARIADRFGIDAYIVDDQVAVPVEHAERFVPQLCAVLDVAIYSVRVIRPTLDDVFMAFTGRAIRDGHA